MTDPQTTKSRLDAQCAEVGVFREDGETDAQLWKRGHDKAVADFRTTFSNVETKIRSVISG